MLLNLYTFRGYTRCSRLSTCVRAYVSKSSCWLTPDPLDIGNRIDIVRTRNIFFFFPFFFFSPPREKQRQFVDIDSSDNSISKEWQPRTDLPRQRSAWSPLCWEICVPTTRIAPSPTASARTGAAFAPRDTRRPATGRNVSVNSILPFFPFSHLLHTYMHLNPFLAKRGSRFSLLK